MRKYFNIVFLALAIYLNFSCTKKNDSNSEVTGQLYFHLHTNIDNSEVDGYNTIIQSASGRKVSLSLAQMYISNIELVKLDNSVYSVTNKVLLKDFENEAYLIGNVPAGNYKSVRFSIGLNSSTSMKSPVSSDTVFYRPEMWFGNTAQPLGYIFLNIEGTVDTTAKVNEIVPHMMPFSYRIGTISNMKQVILPVNDFSILPNKATYSHIIINYMKIFDGVDLSKISNLSVSDTTANSGALAKQVASNIPSMFGYE